jgi:hypothetical protein
MPVRVCASKPVQAGVAVGPKGTKLGAANIVAGGADVADRELQIAIQVNGDGAGGNRLHRLARAAPVVDMFATCKQIVTAQRTLPMSI